MTQLGRTWILLLVVALGATVGCAKEDVEPQSEAEPDVSPNLEALRSLGYVGSYPIKPEHVGKSGVVRHDEQGAHGGLNLYNTDPAPRAHLIDMQGEVVHTWAPQNETWCEGHGSYLRVQKIYRTCGKRPYQTNDQGRPCVV